MRFNLPAVSAVMLMVAQYLTNTAFATERDIEMTIKPKVCQVNRAGDICEMTINIAWQALLPLDTCLYQRAKNQSQEQTQDKNKTLCWQNTKAADTKLAIKLSENTLFTLEQQTPEVNLVLAQQLISVNSTVPKNYRRRLRADWSLF